MANVRNYEEYRAEVLDRLGDDYTVEDLRNTERWRLRVLDMLSGGGSGGGGSSDLSTATVTIIRDPSLDEDFLRWENCPVIISDVVTGVMYTEISPAVITVPLYKGKCYWEKGIQGLTLSGNIEEYDDGAGMLITGDCTITIS